MDVEDLKKKADANKERYIYLFNPLSRDFVCTYDMGDEVVTYTLYSKENKKLRYDVAQTVGEHLIDAWLQNRNIKEARSVSRDKARKVIFPNE